MQVKCKYCGTRFEEKDKYCPYCYARVNERKRYRESGDGEVSRVKSKVSTGSMNSSVNRNRTNTRANINRNNRNRYAMNRQSQVVNRIIITFVVVWAIMILFSLISNFLFWF